MSTEKKHRPTQKKRSIWRIIGWVIYFGAYALVGLTFGLTKTLMEDLPSVEALEDYSPSLPTELYDCKGRLITNYYIERRYIVPLDKIPQALKDGVIATEDEYFYQHFGVNPLAYLRVAVKNIRAGGIRQGGSTITMQLARNLFLTPDRVFSRKMKEIILAMQIEQAYSKDEILQFYFNQMNYGAGCYGAEAASRTYFGKPVDQLDLQESAVLAGLPNAPGAFSPYSNPENATRRRNIVLGRMLDTGKIKPDEFKQAVETEIKPVPMQYAQDRAPYFTEYVRRQLEREYGASGVYRSGLKVFTTLDLDMQEIANESIIWGLDRLEQKGKTQYKPKKIDEKLVFDRFERGQIRYGRVESMDKSTAIVYLGNNIRGSLDVSPAHWGFREKADTKFKVGDEITVKIIAYSEKNNTIELSYEEVPFIQGSMVCLDPHNGEIRALVGGYDFRESPFNRAYQSKRQPGSSFKVFLYTAAFDNGFAPSDVFMDAPFEINALGIQWRPHNYSRSFSNAPMTIRAAVEMSINIVAARLVDQVGVETLVDYAHRMGIKSELPAVYALALGAGDVTVLEMTSAFGTLANEGVHVEPISIKKILDRNGNVLADNSSPVTSVAIPPETAAIMVNVMEGALDHGTAAISRRYGFSYTGAGKTGTTDATADTWFVGFTPDYVTGVWVGCDDHSPLGYSATGETFAVPIWSHFMSKMLAQQGIPNKKFVIPPGVITANVCLESGLLATGKCTKTRMEIFTKASLPDKFCDMHDTMDFYRKSLEMETPGTTSSPATGVTTQGVVPTKPPTVPN